MTVYIDENVTHDHTYFGNGCEANSGNASPCSTRIVQTVDGENQINGTYYHFQAATAGTSGTIASQNTNSPDTFCPLGWQLPYSGTGGDYYNKSRSWNFLFTTYDIKFNDGTTTDVTKIKSYPFSYILSGGIGWTTGKLYDMGNRGRYSSLTIASDSNSYRMLITNIQSVQIIQSVSKTAGNTIRCASNWYPISFPWHPRKTLNILGFIKLLNEPEME